MESLLPLFLYLVWMALLILPLRKPAPCRWRLQEDETSLFLISDPGETPPPEPSGSRRYKAAARPSSRPGFAAPVIVIIFLAGLYILLMSLD